MAGGGPLWDTARFVHAYLALLSAGFRRQATYRLALVSGLLTNLFFGLVRTALFYALYRERPEAVVGGLGLADALTYVVDGAGDVRGGLGELDLGVPGGGALG